MKILYIITRSDVIGGASVHLLDLAEGFKLIGHEILILVGGEGVFVDAARKRGLRVQSLRNLVREISPWKDLRAISEIICAIEDFSPDIVHLHSSKAGVVGRLAAWLKNIPAVFTAHGWAFTDGISPGKKRFYRAIECALARISQRIVAVSNYDRDLALRQGVGNAKLIVTIPNGVKDVLFSQPKKRSDQIIKFIMVARFDEPKDHALLLRAFAAIKDEPWSIEFVGEGPSLAQCQELVFQLKLSDRVVFSGFCDDVDQRLAVSDVSVLASKWEGLPLTIIEAMRGGLPVIASNVGGVPELVIDGVTGFLVEEGSESAMTAGLKAALNDARRLRVMGEAARARYERHFSFDTMRGRTEAIYQSVLSKARS